MAVIIPFLAWLAFGWLSRHAHDRIPDQDWDWRDSFAESSIAWALILFAITESLSAFNQVTRLGLVMAWTLVLLIAIGGIAYFRKGAPRAEGPHMRRWPWAGRLETREWVLLSMIALVAVATGVVAWVVPPSDADSLAYHMSRVVHWAQNHSVAHYPTPDSRQVWMPPWAEYAILHLFVLVGSDRLANLAQCFSVLGMTLVASRIAGLLGASRTGQVVAGVFVATLPPVIAQAAGADTDVVAAFWVVCMCWVLLRFGWRRAGWEGWGLAASTAGLAALTKGTSIVYALPLVVWFVVLQLRQIGRRQWFAMGLSAGLIVAALVTPMWVRNWVSFGSFLGPTEHLELLGNGSLGLLPTLSNLVRNVSSDLANPSDRLNNLIASVVVWAHRAIGMDPSDPTTTYAGNTYRLGWLWPGSNSAPVHFSLGVLAAVSLMVAGPEKDRRRGLGLALAASLGLVLYSAIFKWQGAIRFQIPVLVLMAPLVGSWLGAWRPPWLTVGLASILLVVVIPTVVFDPWRPLVPIPPRTSASSVLNRPRPELYFRATEDMWTIYSNVATQVVGSGCGQVGLRIDSHEREYLWWVMLRPWDRQMRIEHLLIYPGLEKYVDPTFKPCAVICTVCSVNSNPLPGVVGQDMGKGVWLYLSSPPASAANPSGLGNSSPITGLPWAAILGSTGPGLAWSPAPSIGRHTPGSGIAGR